MSAMVAIDDFKDSKWSADKTDDKLKKLQELENQYAVDQGRPAVKISLLTPTTPQEDRIAGAYDHDAKPHCITINKNMLDDPSCKFEVLDTIIHEGRHAYQHWVRDNNRTDLESRQLISKWTEDEKSGGYIGPFESEYKYRYQAVERDAYDYARREMDNKFSQLIGEEKEYEKYRLNVDTNDKRLKTTGEISLGLDFETKIDSEVHKRYETIQRLKAGIPASVISTQNQNATTIRERLPDEYTLSQDENSKERSGVVAEGFDFHKALAAHIKGNEEMYAQLDAQRGGQHVVQQMPQQEKGLLRG